MRYSYMVLLIYVNEAIDLLMSIVLSPKMTHQVPRLSPYILCVRGLLPFLSLMSRLLVAIYHPVKDEWEGTLSDPFWCLCQKLSKLWVIKPHHWPWIEFFSYRAQECKHLSWLGNSLSKQWPFPKMMMGDEYTCAYEWNGTGISNHMKIILPSTEI